MSTVALGTLGRTGGNACDVRGVILTKNKQEPAGVIMATKAVSHTYGNSVSFSRWVCSSGCAHRSLNVRGPLAEGCQHVVGVVGGWLGVGETIGSVVLSQAWSVFTLSLVMQSYSRNHKTSL